MKALLTTAILVIAFAAPAAEARVARHHTDSQVSSGIQAQAKTGAKKAVKAKKKHGKKGHKKSA